MKISIIIPTFNRKNMLQKLLHNLTQHKNGKVKIEIIVADDLSTDDTKKMVSQEFPDIVVVSGKGKSSSLSKRAGIEASSGDYIVAIDDDALPESDWITEVLPAIIRGEHLIQSKIVFRDMGQENQNDESDVSFRTGFKLNMYPELVTYGGKNEQYINNCAECGLFMSRKVLSEVPLDDPNLVSDFGEAASFYIRAKKLGYKVFFQPRSVINHIGANTGGGKEREKKIAPRKEVTPYVTGMVHNFFLFARMAKPSRIPYMIIYFIAASIFLSIQQRKNCLPYFLKGIIGGLKARFKPMRLYSWVRIDT